MTVRHTKTRTRAKLRKKTQASTDPDKTQRETITAIQLAERRKAVDERARQRETNKATTRDLTADAKVFRNTETGAEKEREARKEAFKERRRTPTQDPAPAADPDHAMGLIIPSKSKKGRTPALLTFRRGTGQQGQGGSERGSAPHGVETLGCLFRVRAEPLANLINNTFCMYYKNHQLNNTAVVRFISVVTAFYLSSTIAASDVKNSIDLHSPNTFIDQLA